MTEHTTASVFGIARDLPQNYVVRESVDGSLIDNLTRDKHLVIYGSSKQGKTCLRKHCLEDDDYITVTCSNKWDMGQLHAAVLKSAGYTLEVAQTRTVSGDQKVSASLSATLKLPGVATITGKAGGEDGEGETIQTSNKKLELDVHDVNDVIDALNNIDFKKYIVLEDFHYLPADTQQDFAVALKAFHEASDLCFIVVGVWLEENRLIQFNGDLTGRVVAINADRWSDQELEEVISAGEALLTVKFDEAFVRDLVRGAFESVYIVQESCYRACVQSGINNTQKTLRSVGMGLDAKSLVKSVVDEQSGRYSTFIGKFAAGFQDTRLEMYKWLLYPVLTTLSEDLEHGLRLSGITKTIQSHHSEGSGLNQGNVTQALQSTASLQVKKGIVPIILDYDQTNSQLNIVDRGFLIWLSYQDRARLLSEAGLPFSNAT